MSKLLVINLTCVLVLSPGSAQARSTVITQGRHESPVALSDKARGLELYKQGNYKGAINVLRALVKREKTDADAWYYLGLSYNRDGDQKEARKAFEQTVKLRPDFADAHAALAYTLLTTNKLRDAERRAAHVLTLNPKNVDAHYVLGAVSLRSNDLSKALKAAEAALRLNANHAPALFLKTQALVGQALGDVLDGDEEPPGVQKQRLDEAAAALEKLIKLTPNAPDADRWREQLEIVRVYARATSEDDPHRTIFNAKEVTKKAVLLTKPEPGFTYEARQHSVTGTVKLRMVLAADGKVKHLLVVKGLPHGLTELAVAAARKITFIPAQKDGKPVSTVVTIEYNFNIY